LTFLITGLLSFVLPISTVALIAMFQGAVALPIALFLERRLGSKRMESNNPLRSLSGQMAVSQALGLPALIAAYSLDPTIVPLVLASLGGVHFLPYSWLHRSRIYLYLAAVVSLGAFLIQLLLPSNEFTIILLFVAVIYLVAAIPLYRNAARLTVGSTTKMQV
jgi:hypothetical protein